MKKFNITSFENKPKDKKLSLWFKVTPHILIVSTFIRAAARMEGLLGLLTIVFWIWIGMSIEKEKGKSFSILSKVFVLFILIDIPRNYLATVELIHQLRIFLKV
ncbi:MAG: hypothetical protein WCG98_08295 [bacterium]